MKPLIQKIHSKGIGKMNEDQLLIKDNLYAVFDGATSLIDFINKDGKTGGRLAAETAKQVFSKNKGKLNELALEANNKILEKMKKENFDISRKDTLWSTCAAVVRLMNDKVEYFQIGDSMILVIFKDSSYKLIAEYEDSDLEIMEKWRELANKKIKNIWELIKPLIRKSRKRRNINFGRLDGEKEAVKFFKFGEFPLKNVRSLIIFTDGLFIPKENPKDPEDWSLFVKLYQESGLKGLLKYVRSVEKRDPCCWKYPRVKQHDDATAIGIDF